MKPIPLIRKVILAPAISYLNFEGVPVRRYLRQARLTAPSPETLDSLMPLYQLCDFLDLVAHGEGLDDLGFRISGDLGTECLGTFGRLLAHAFTLHEATQISRELISHFNSGQRVWIEDHGDQVRYCQKLVGCLPRNRTREANHLEFAVTAANARVVGGTDCQPTRIELPTDPIDIGAHFPEFADLPISFNQPHVSLWFEQTRWSRPLPKTDSSDSPVSDGDERATFVTGGPDTDPIGQLEQVVESALRNPEMSVQFIAAAIGTTARTLQRRLAEHDASFSRLLQGVRFRKSQQLLRDPGMPLTEIAKRLGYTDPSNFIRAFNRWTGVGPTEFRRLHFEQERG